MRYLTYTPLYDENGLSISPQALCLFRIFLVPSPTRFQMFFSMAYKHFHPQKRRRGEQR